MYQKIALITEKLKTAHEDAWNKIADPGDFFSGEERLEMVRATRDADDCELTIARKNAISPFAVTGEYAGDYLLDSNAVDVIRRIASDPGRLTKTWFAQVIANGLAPEEYVEVVSVVTTSIIIDTLHQALGLAQPLLPKANEGSPRKVLNSEAIEIGAWVPVLDVPSQTADHGLPKVPNIARSLGLVPSALQLFFGTFSPHYSLSNIQSSLSQDQAEFVASRVSAMNECFY